MTQTVKTTYKLSQAGQKAALLAGRNASATVTEDFPFDAALLDDLTINPDGSLSLDISANGWEGGVWRSALELDAPPATLADVVNAQRARKAAISAEIAAAKAEREAREAAEREAKRLKAGQDEPVVDALLAELEALDPLAPLPAGVHLSSYNRLARDGYYFNETEAQAARHSALVKRREQAERDAKAAAELAKQSALDAMIAEHGGYRWETQASMCDFKGFNLWVDGQSRRWVGKFTAPKGIDTFCDSPRGEYIFDVSDLVAGDCIQGGGYDTNSRGKRRHESEFFGVVVRNGGGELVVDICDTRGEALKRAKKLAEVK